MKSLVMVLAVAAMALPASALTYFDATANGSWDVYFTAEGYSNCGGTGQPRMFGGGSSGKRATGASRRSMAPRTTAASR